MGEELRYVQEDTVMQPSQMGTRAGLAPTQRLPANGPSEEWQSLTQDAQGVFQEDKCRDLGPLSCRLDSPGRQCRFSTAKRVHSPDPHRQRL